MQALLRWQQADGAFLPDNPTLSPVVFSAQAMAAMLDAGFISESALSATLSYLQQHMIQPAQQHYFPVPEYACGGVYSGLLDGCLPVVTTAYVLKLMRRAATQQTIRSVPHVL